MSGVEGPDLVAVVERTAAVQTAHGGDRPTIPDPVAATAVSGVSQAPATRMALAVSALDGPAIVCTLPGGEPAMRGRIDEWRDVIGRAAGRQALARGVALQYEHDATVAVELARLAAAEFACCSFFEFSLTVGPAGDGVRRHRAGRGPRCDRGDVRGCRARPGGWSVMRTVTRDELRALLDVDAVVLVEALPVEAYEAEHLPSAVNVAGDLTPDQAGTIAPDPGRTVVVYCSGPACSRSKVTAAAFERLGYTDVRVYPGGKADWWQAGLPLTGHRAQAEV